MSGRPLDDLLEIPVTADQANGAIYALMHVIAETARRTGTAKTMAIVANEMALAEGNAHRADANQSRYDRDSLFLRHLNGRNQALVQLFNLLNGRGVSHSKTPTGREIGD